MALATYRHFCAASRVLDEYLKHTAFAGEPELCAALSEAVTLSLRTEDVRKPDHQHRNRTENTFDGCKNLADMLLAALGAQGVGPCVHGLEVHHGLLYVCAPQMEDWQREVTAYQSPVPLMAAAWARYCRNSGKPYADGLDAICDTLRCSSLPGVHDQHLHRLIQNEHGMGRLCDLHVHINGSTEFTPVWLHSLQHQTATCHELEQAQKNCRKPVDYFHRQLRTDVPTVRQHLRMASILRFWLCRLLQSYTPAYADQPLPTVRDVVSLIRGGYYSEDIPHKHPFLNLSAHLGFSEPQNNLTALQLEGAMWLYAIWLLHDTRNFLLALLMHSYMLLMHQHMRLLVQQPEQYGFDQFQYITLAGGREAAEAAGKLGFEARFRQFHGMYGPDMAYVEARFSPKEEPASLTALLTSIWRGYRAATGQKDDKGLTPCPACPLLAAQFCIQDGVVRPRVAPERATQRFSLGLVAHFIKEEDRYNGSRRHGALRNKIDKRARTLVLVRQNLQQANPALAAALVGKDAASNELHTPPEVFAPVFRYLHREGITRSTYHAGEDFEHILCGIRAVHEAMTFLDMRSGDRIGHATALGIDPEQCHADSMYCSQGKWLDSLVWLTRLIQQSPALKAFGGEIALLQTSIARLHRDIYGKPCPELAVLWKAWELRKYDIRDFDMKREAIHQSTQREREALQAEEREAGSALFTAAKEQLQLYHCTAREWEKMITVSKEEQPSFILLRAVQDTVVQEMRNRNILVEVLPTSNVRISHYNVTETHHVMRWLNPDNDRPVPQVVLGTDDPGIFSTTLRNEYSLILNELQKQYPGRSEKPYEIVHHLIENGFSYSFGKR